MNTHIKRRKKIVLKGFRIIRSCQTRSHCMTAHNWLKLAEKELLDKDMRWLNQSYLTKILQVTGMIS